MIIRHFANTHDPPCAARKVSVTAATTPTQEGDSDDSEGTADLDLAPTQDASMGFGDAPADASTASDDSNYEIYTMNVMGAELTVKVTKSPTLFCFGFNNKLRQFCINNVILNKYFDYVMVLIIVINSIIIVLNDPPEDAEYVFLAIFTVELILKSIGFGFRDYIADHWNKLDFLVVVIGFFGLLPAVDNYSAIRALKVFRIFRCVTAVPSLRVMVLTLGYCINEILLVSGPILFVVVMFAIFGLHLFIGQLHNKCACMPGAPAYNTSAHGWVGHNATHGWLGSAAGYGSWMASATYVSDGNGDVQICGNATGAFSCPSNSSICGYQPSVCLEYGPNPNDGYTSFDNFGWSTLAVIQIITLDFWENIYRKIVAAVGAAPIVYFVVVIMFGAFFVMNIMLAVVSSRYFITKNEDERARALERPAVVVREKTIFNTATVVSEWRHRLQKRIETFKFVLFINLTIVANTITMALSHPFMSDTLAQYIRISNFIFAAIFSFEVIVKLVAYGFKDYFAYVKQPRDSKFRSSRGWNTFDFTVVFVSILEIILNESASDDSGFSGLSIIRVVRLMRILKFMSSRKGMQRLLNAIGSGLGASVPLVTIGGIVVYAFAAIGLQLFREDYKKSLTNMTNIWDPVNNVTLKEPSEDFPRWHFLDFQHAFLMIFRILCGEWIEPLWETMNYSGKGAIIFYLLVVLIGNFVVFNLFIAVLLGAFEEEASAERREKANKELEKKLEKRRSMRMSTAVINPMSNVPSRGVRELDDEDGQSVTVLVTPSASEDKIANSTTTGSAVRSPPADRLAPGAPKDNLSVTVADQTPHKMPSNQSVQSDKSKTSQASSSPSDQSYSKLSQHAKFEEDQRRKRARNPQTGLCCCVDEPTCLAVARGLVYRLVETTAFNIVIFVCIVFSSITLCFEDIHYEENDDLQTALLSLDIFFCVIFALEMTLKIVAYGWKGYFYDGWNVLDFLLVVISVVSLSASGYNAIRALRVLRALRPLRAVKNWESMRTVVNAMFASIPSLFHVLVVLTLSWLSFSILGVQLFGGMFFKCVDRDSGERVDAALVPDKATCCAMVNNATNCDVSNPAGLYYWRNSHVNFDNTINAFMALFLVGTYEGFEGVIMDSVDSVGIDKQPIHEYRFFAFYFYVLFILLGAFFALNLVITAVIDAFQAQKDIAEKQKKTDGVPFSEKQERLMMVTLAILQKRPKKMVNPPTEGPRAVAYRMCESTWFQVVIVTCILLNTICYTLKWYGMDETVSESIYWLNVFFTLVYLVEAIIKLFAMHLHYFADGWNRFDFLIVIISLISLFIDIGTGGYGESNGAAVLSSVRMLRCLKLMRFIPKLEMVTATFKKSLSALVNVALLLFMVMFIFSIVGMSFFKHLSYNGVITAQFNFETFGRSMLLLFQLCTGAGWSDVVDACSLQPPDCDSTYGGYDNGNCGNPAVSQVYFSVYIILMSLILISAYIAILLEHLQDEEDLSSAGNIPQKEYDTYYNIWQKYDPDADQYIDEEDLLPFLSEIKPPLGLEGSIDAEALLDLGIPLFVKPLVAKQGEMDTNTQEMALRTEHPDGEQLQAHCADILCALVRRKIMSHEVHEDKEDIIDDHKEVDTIVQEKLAKSFPSRVNRTSVPILRSRKVQEEARNLSMMRASLRMKAVLALQPHHDDEAATPGAGKKLDGLPLNAAVATSQAGPQGVPLRPKSSSFKKPDAQTMDAERLKQLADVDANLPTETAT